MYQRIKNKRAFTLAEVLITLLIIGVIASIVIPGLIADTQQAEYKTAWKKAFGVASQAYKRAIAENGSFGPYGSNTGKLDALKNYMSIVKNCSGSTFGNCWATNGVTRQDGSYPGGGCVGYSQSNQNVSNAFITSDGMYWLQYSNMDCVAVDTNGIKGPNKFGKDVFDFYMTESVVKPNCCSSTESVDYLK